MFSSTCDMFECLLIFNMLVVVFLNTHRNITRVGATNILWHFHTHPNIQGILITNLSILHCSPEHVEVLIFVLQLTCFAILYTYWQRQQNSHYMQHQTQIKSVVHVYLNPRQSMGRTKCLLQMNGLSLRNNRLKFETAGKLRIMLEDSMEYTSNS